MHATSSNHLATVHLLKSHIDSVEKRKRKKKRQLKKKCNFKFNKFSSQITSEENTFNTPLNQRNFYIQMPNKYRVWRTTCDTIYCRVCATVSLTHTPFRTRRQNASAIFSHFLCTIAFSIYSFQIFDFISLATQFELVMPTVNFQPEKFIFFLARVNRHYWCSSAGEHKIILFICK